jgi:transcriptional regulator with XRE-family HTH domain
MLAAECRDRLGQNLLLARKRAGMSQETVAVGAGLHRTEIGLLERGERVPKIDTLLKVAGAMSVPPHQLLQGIAWEPATTTKGSFTVSEPEAPETANS